MKIFNCSQFKKKRSSEAKKTPYHFKGRNLIMKHLKIRKAVILLYMIGRTYCRLLYEKCRLFFFFFRKAIDHFSPTFSPPRSLGIWAYIDVSPLATLISFENSPPCLLKNCDWYSWDICVLIVGLRDLLRKRKKWWEAVDMCILLLVCRYLFRAYICCMKEKEWAQEVVTQF